MSNEVERQAKPLRDLIDYARERDALGKRRSTRLQLIHALMTLGNTRKEAERTIENARVRVRKVANQAERLLEHYLRHEDLWRWTHPREAVREMRRRMFDGAYMDLPETDIEYDLVRNANALLILAVYPALRNSISKQLSKLSVEARQQAMQGAKDASSPHSNDPPPTATTPR
jgi:hypothetical protein